MNIISGKGVSRGIAIGAIKFYQRIALDVEKRSITDPEAEIERFHSASGTAAIQLSELCVKLAEKLGTQNSLLFEIHKMMLEDLDYQESVCNIIRSESVCAEYAVGETAKNFAQMFASMDDEYMQARAADVQDVSKRVLEILSGKQLDISIEGEPVIYASDDFSPSETAQFDRDIVLALLTAAGTSNSHTAIFARTMGIPAIASIGDTLQGIKEGTLVVVDGSEGKIIIDPEEAVLADYRERLAQQLERQAKLQQLKGKTAVSVDGQQVLLCANIGGVDDAALALENDADGIGLFRSEFLYLQTSDYPTEDAQFEAYKAVAEKMDGRPVVIRTLDIGADKQIDYFEMEKEENPALGYRAIRICLDRIPIFKTQLRALYRASAFGKISIMFPMIIAVEEILRIKEIVKEVQSELDAEGIAYDKDVELGIMIETPAAVMVSDQLAQEVNFFSVGTNDLTQYTLAIDRQNSKLEGYYDPHHLGLLRMIQLAADNIHKYPGKWIGICGELGADLTMTEAFLAIGIDELSVTPKSILPLKEKVLSTDVAACKEAVLNKFAWT